jgi:hypothetical protein
VPALGLGGELLGNGLREGARARASGEAEDPTPAGEAPLEVPEELEVVVDLRDPAEDPIPLGDQGFPYAVLPSSSRASTSTSSVVRRIDASKECQSVNIEPMGSQ